MGPVGEPNYPGTLLNKLLLAVTTEHGLLVTLAPSTDRADQSKGNTSRWGFLFHPSILPTYPEREIGKRRIRKA
jgi:hypothetical protein